MNDTTTAAPQAQAKTKSNSVISTKVDPVAKTLTFVVVGASPTGGSMELKVWLDKMSQENRDYSAYHGVGQKVRDAAAIPFDTEAKRYATPGEKYEAMKVVVDHLNSGSTDWNPKRTAKGPGSEELMLTKALAEVYPDKSVDEVRTKVLGYTKAERLALMDHPKVKPIVERLRAENVAASQVDAEKLLEGF